MHGILDYITVIFLLLSPAIFKMEGNLCTITYALGIAHFCLTILTKFELGLIKIIPFKIHGILEVIISLFLAAVAFWFYNELNLLGYYYYLTLSAVILLVFILTDFKSARHL